MKLKITSVIIIMSGVFKGKAMKTDEDIRTVIKSNIEAFEELDLVV